MDIALDIASTILDGFNEHSRAFREISAEARERFERAEGAAGRQASRSRIDLYDRQVQEAVARVCNRFRGAHTDERVWPKVKQADIGLLYDHKRPECAETFFNSVACRVLDRSYYRNDYIFWRLAVAMEFIDGERPTYRCWYPHSHHLRRTMREILASFAHSSPSRTSRTISAASSAHCGRPSESCRNDLPTSRCRFCAHSSIGTRAPMSSGVSSTATSPSCLPYRFAMPGMARRCASTRCCSSRSRSARSSASPAPTSWST